MAKSSFEQIYQAFGGYSPGGLDQPDATGTNRILYLRRKSVEKIDGWEEIVKTLNEGGLVGDIARIEVVDRIPVCEVYKMANGKVQVATVPLRLID